MTDDEAARIARGLTDERQEEALDIERDIRIAIWNGTRWQGSPQEVAQSLIRKIMAEPTMVRALANVEALAVRAILESQTHDG